MTKTACGHSVPELCRAAEQGDLDAIAEILAVSPQLATQDTASNDEHQALHFAVYGNQPDVVRLLLAAGADPLNGIYPHRDATHPLAMAQDRSLQEIVDIIEGFLAAARGTSDRGLEVAEATAVGGRAAVTALLDQDAALVNATDRHGQTPLFKAIGCGDFSMVRLLLERGADVDHADAEGRTPLNRCLFQNWKIPDAQYAAHTAIAGLLVGHGASYDLCAAAALGDVAGIAAKLATEPEALHAEKAYNPVVVASFRGHVDALRALLDAGADPDAPHAIEVAGDKVEQWGQPLWLACNRGHYEIAELLLADLLFLHGATVDDIGYALTGDMAALAERVKAEPERQYEIMWAGLLAGNEQMVRYRLEHGPAVSSEEEQFNLLASAIRGWRIGDLKINNEGWDRRSLHRNFELLLAHGFNPNLRKNRNRADFTIMHHLAARACNSRTYGHTPEEIVEFARALLDAGAEIDPLEAQLQSTPLGWAVRYGNIALVRYLLQRGSDPNKAGAGWARPLAWAGRTEQSDIAEVLQEHGGTFS
jgi:ankyrin repeat protein